MPPIPYTLYTSDDPLFADVPRNENGTFNWSSVGISGNTEGTFRSQLNAKYGPNAWNVLTGQNPSAGSYNFTDPSFWSGTPYEGMTNPYLPQIDFDEVNKYLSGSWGLFDKAPQRNYELYLMALEWDANMQSAVGQWNAEADIYGQQVEGQQAAGLNPDLTGVSGNSAGAAGVDAPSSETNAGSPSDTGADAVGFLFSIADTVLSSINAYYGVASASARIVGQQLMNEGQEVLNDTRRLARASSEFDTVVDYFVNTFSESELKAFYDGKETAAFSIVPEDFASATGLSLEQAKRMSEGWNKRLSSPAAMDTIYGAISKRYKALGDVKDVISTPGFKDNFDPNSVIRNHIDLMIMGDNAMNNFRKADFNFRKQVSELLNPYAAAGAENASNSYNMNYYRALSPFSAAAAENAQNKYNADFYNSLNPEVEALARIRNAEFNRIRNDFEKGIYEKVMSIVGDGTSTATDLTFAEQLMATYIQGRSMTFDQWKTSWFGKAAAFTTGMTNQALEGLSFGLMQGGLYMNPFVDGNGGNVYTLPPSFGMSSGSGSW